MTRYRTDDEGVVSQPKHTLAKPSNGSNDRDHLSPSPASLPVGVDAPDTILYGFFIGALKARQADATRLPSRALSSLGRSATH